MKVSVIIPSHNRHQMLGEAVASVAEQTYADIELIVIDDSSEPPVDEIVVRKWTNARSHKDLKIIRLNAHNANAGRNAGLEVATGDLIQFLDSDDLLQAQKIELQAGILREHLELEMVTCYEELFRQRPGDWGVLWNVDWNERELSTVDRFFNNDPVWQTAGPLWRVDFLRSGMLWNEKLMVHQDWEFHTRVLIHGITFKRIPQSLVFIREHDSRSKNIVDYFKRLESRMGAIEAIIDAANDNDAWTPERRMLLEGELRRRIEDLAGNYSPEINHIRRNALLLATRIAAKRRRKATLRLLWALAPLPLFQIAYRLYVASSSWIEAPSTHALVINPATNAEQWIDRKVSSTRESPDAKR